MYAGKEYKKEAEYFAWLIKRFQTIQTKKVLSLAAGTLNHEQYLLKKGFEIRGVEFSPDMVRIAKEKIKKEKLKNVSIEQGDMRSFNFPINSFDAVLSMFNSVSYCQGLKELEKVIKNTSQVLKKDGLFIFDCWNVRAIRKDSPQKRWVKFIKGNKTLVRLTDPKLDEKKGAVKLAFELIEIQGKKITGHETEIHMTYGWEINDIDMLFKKYGLELIHHSQFMKDEPISDNAWAMTVVGKKN
jgi:SAM-dependent methyltransferase